MKRFGFYGGLFIVTALTLMLQLIQTRILSVVAWYHLPSSSSASQCSASPQGRYGCTLRRERFTEHTLSHDLPYFTSAFAVTTALAVRRSS